MLCKLCRRFYSELPDMMLWADFGVQDLHHFRLKSMKNLDEGGSSPSEIIMTKLRFAQIETKVIVVRVCSGSSKLLLDILCFEQ